MSNFNDHHEYNNMINSNDSTSPRDSMINRVEDTTLLDNQQNSPH